MNALRALLIRGCCLSLLSLPAAAGDGWFGGIRVAPWVNRSDALLNLDRGPDASSPPGGASRRKGGNAANLAGSRRFDVEVGYAEGSPEVAGTGRPSSTARDFRVAGVGTWAVGDGIGVTGRVGVYHGNVDAASIYRLTPEDSALHPTYGMGMRYDINPNLRLQGGWDRYHLGPSLVPGDAGIDLLSIGLKYRF